MNLINPGLHHVRQIYIFQFFMVFCCIFFVVVVGGTSYGSNTKLGDFLDAEDPVIKPNSKNLKH